MQPFAEAVPPSGVGPRLFLSHAVIAEADVPRLADVEQLVLWNVRRPADLFARLPRLRFLDIRGGSGAVAPGLELATGVQALCVSHVRGLTDLSALPGLSGLQFLYLYALPRVERLPSLAPLTCLRRAQLGGMKRLESLAPVLDAPALEELELSEQVPMTVKMAERARAHPGLQAFGWVAEKVPLRELEPVRDALPLPRPEMMRPEDWFDRHVQGRPG